MIISKKLTIKVCFICCLSILSISSQVIAANNKTVSVLGYLSQLPKKLWQNSHVGFGVQNQLKQHIYDSNRFDLKEEKEIGSRRFNLNEQANEQVKKADPWMLEFSDISKQNLNNKASTSKVDLIFWVEVVKFGNLGSTFTFGAFSSKSKKTTLVAKVCVFKQYSGNIICETGEGKSRRKSSSFIYKKKEHRLGEKVFDGSMVGKISNIAVEKAFSKLLEKI